MDIVKNIKNHYKERRLIHNEVANFFGARFSNDSKMEKGEREFGIEVKDKLSKFFLLNTNELLFPNHKTPKKVKVEEKTTIDNIQLISQLDDGDINEVYRIIDTMHTKLKFQTAK